MIGGHVRERPPTCHRQCSRPVSTCHRSHPACPRVTVSPRAPGLREHADVRRRVLEARPGGVDHASRVLVGDVPGVDRRPRLRVEGASSAIHLGIIFTSAAQRVIAAIFT